MAFTISDLYGILMFERKAREISMDIYAQLNNYINKNCGYNGKRLDYNFYIKTESNTASPLIGLQREVDDLVSVVAWSTSLHGAMDLVYATLSGRRLHAAKLDISAFVSSSLHTHNYVELAYVAEGRLLQKIKEKNVSFCKGEICLVDHSTPHSDIFSSEPAAILCLGLNDLFFSQCLQASPSLSENMHYMKRLITKKKSEYDYIRFVPKEDGELTKQTFEILFDELLHSRPEKDSIVRGYVKRLTHLLASEYRIVLNQKDKDELSKALFKDIEEYIEHNYSDVSVQKLADIYHYSADYLSRICCKESGMNLSKYIQKVRIEKSLFLLNTTDYPVEQISRQVGYNNVGFFYEKFKEHYQTTPNKIRMSMA